MSIRTGSKNFTPMRHQQSSSRWDENGAPNIQVCYGGRPYCPCTLKREPRTCGLPRAYGGGARNLTCRRKTSTVLRLRNGCCLRAQGTATIVQSPSAMSCFHAAGPRVPSCWPKSWFHRANITLVLVVRTSEGDTRARKSKLKHPAGFAYPISVGSCPAARQLEILVDD